jgi:NADPH-dependent curcumin reductase CurA
LQLGWNLDGDAHDADLDQPPGAPLDGIEHATDAIAGLYRGENLGKRLIKLR